MQGGFGPERPVVAGSSGLTPVCPRFVPEIWSLNRIYR